MITKQNEEPNTEPHWLWISVSTIIGVLLLFGIIAYFQYSEINKIIESDCTYDISVYGISGDFFGLTNAVFSALAFAMIIVTLWMQKYELKQQREELEITRKVMKQQKEEMEEQNESLRRQRFENTFFNMLEMHGEIVATICSVQDGKTGRLAFGSLVTRLFNYSRDKIYNNESQKDAHGVSIKSYENWYSSRESEIGHYFRTLYNLIRYIDENGRDQKMTYSRLVRAQLSYHELQLLLYNGLSKYGKEKFKPLIEKYSLLKHLNNTEATKNIKIWFNEYDPTAFGSVSNVEAGKAIRRRNELT